MDQTIQMAFRIALVWAMGFLIAVAVRALLPGDGRFEWVYDDGLARVFVARYPAPGTEYRKPRPW